MDPYYAFTRKVEGKTKTLQLRLGPRLAKIEREVETYRDFRATCEQLLEVNEAICDARPVAGASDSSDQTTIKKKLRRPSRKKLRGK